MCPHHRRMKRRDACHGLLSCGDEAQPLQEAQGLPPVLEHGRVAEDPVAHGAELVVDGGAHGLRLAFAIQRCANLLPFEAELAHLVRQSIGAGDQRPLDHAELVHQSPGQDEQTLRLDEADGFLLDGPELRVRVEHALGELVTHRVVAENQAHLVAALDADHTGRQGALPRAGGVMAGDAQGLVVIDLPCGADGVRHLEQLVALLGHQSHGRAGPVEDLDAHAAMARQRQRLAQAAALNISKISPPPW